MRPEIKICGLGTATALEAALDGGASHVGFIFFPRSPRNVTPDQAGHLRGHARGRAAVVAVTVDADDAALDAIVAALAPEMLQLHGGESPQRVGEVKARYRLPVMKAFAVSTAADLGRIVPYRGVADRFLFDARPPVGSDLPGGNGVSFDWSILSGLDPSIDYMLSGGLNARNVAEAMRLASPPGLDVSSGVESAPGVKDAGAIRDFFAAVHAARS